MISLFTMEASTVWLFGKGLQGGHMSSHKKTSTQRNLLGTENIVRMIDRVILNSACLKCHQFLVSCLSPRKSNICFSSYMTQPPSVFSFTFVQKHTRTSQLWLHSVANQIQCGTYWKLIIICWQRRSGNISHNLKKVIRSHFLGGATLAPRSGEGSLPIGPWPVSLWLLVFAPIEEGSLSLSLSLCSYWGG